MLAAGEAGGRTGSRRGCPAEAPALPAGRRQPSPAAEVPTISILLFRSASVCGGSASLSVPPLPASSGSGGEKRGGGGALEGARLACAPGGFAPHFAGQPAASCSLAAARMPFRKRRRCKSQRGAAFSPGGPARRSPHGPSPDRGGDTLIPAPQIELLLA